MSIKPLRIGEERFRPLAEEYERLTGHRPYVSCWQYPSGEWRFNLESEEAIFHDSTQDAENWLRWQVDEARRSGVRERDNYGG